MISVEGFYFLVTDLKRSIDFYEKLLDIKPSHVEGDRWADFYYGGEKYYFGLLCDKEINKLRKVGNNGVLNLRSNDIEQDFEKAKSMGAKILTEICDTPESPYEYMSFNVEDPDGNVIEVAQY
jgi:lactoylglutathione lyase